MNKKLTYVGYAAGIVTWLVAIACLGFSPTLYYVLSATAIVFFLVPLLIFAARPKALHGS